MNEAHYFSMLIFYWIILMLEEQDITRLKLISFLKDLFCWICCNKNS